jgi:hypothetical protein
MNTHLVEAAEEILRWAEASGLPACLIGGMAVQRWGKPRLTQDVDVSLLPGLGNEDGVIRRLLERFEPRSSGMADFARANRVALVRASNGVPVDLALGFFAFDEEMLLRATPGPTGKPIWKVALEMGASVPASEPDEYLYGSGEGSR